MSQQFQAIYENGILRPLTPLELPEHAEVSVIVSEGKVAAAPEAFQKQGDDEPFDLKKQQEALDAMFRAIDALPQTPCNDGLSNRDHDQILYGSSK